ncbi:MAG: NADH-quinone oxidoreductase subunit J [Actinomycetota bacterium]|nr:NADH-quinone oxidoreductase subunit J [Actinomycetota bacterium]
MSVDVIVFGVAFVVALGSSMAMIFARSPVHIALFLVIAQVALALTFLLQGAFFVAAVQIIVYAGAIMVLFLFVIMLLGVDRREVLTEPFSAQRPIAVALGALLAAEITYLAVRGDDLVANSPEGEQALLDLNRDPGNVESIARVLFSDYLLPFEVTSVLLVAAIVGVMVLARRMENVGDIKQIERSAPGKESGAAEGRGADDRAKEEVS